MAVTLLAGVARTDITPPLGIAHAGWGAQTHQRAGGVDLPLWATALALSDGDETVVILDIDLIYIWEHEAVAVQQAIAELTGLPTSHIRFSYTHTHSGPANGSLWSSWFKEGADLVGSYDASLPHRLAGVAWAALRDMHPARIVAGSGSCVIGVNRRFHRPEDGAVIVGRNPDRPVDHEVKLVRIDHLDGRPLAAVVNYACHPITVGPDCDLVTPDYPGVMKRVVEQATGATCLFLQGAAGDIGPIRGVARRGLQEYPRLGALLGHEASRVWWEVEPLERSGRYLGTLESGSPLAIYDDVPNPVSPDIRPGTLRVATRELRLPLKALPDPDEMAAQAALHTARLDDLRATGGADDEIRWETMLVKRATMRLDLARSLQGQSHRTFVLQTFLLGNEIALVAMPGEPFVEIGLAVKRQSPFRHTLFSGYSNIGWAYIPMPDVYADGGYEVEVSPFAPQAAGVVIDESLAMLREMAE